MIRGEREKSQGLVVSFPSLILSARSNATTTGDDGEAPEREKCVKRELVVVRPFLDEETALILIHIRGCFS